MSSKNDLYVYKVLEQLRSKLLDLSGRNNLISYRHSTRSLKQIRIIDESLEQILSKLNEENFSFQFRSIPEPVLEFLDEKTTEFQECLNSLKETDEEYINGVEGLGEEPSDKALLGLENKLKDKVRNILKLPAVKRKIQLSIDEQAREVGINPSFELITSSSKKNHTDEYLQTLLYDEDLKRKLKSIYEFNNLNETETGISTLFCSFGFLEWYESEHSEKKITSPLILMPIKIDRTLQKGEHTYKILQRGDGVVNNESLIEKLKSDFGISLPIFEEGASIQSYLSQCEELVSKYSNWRIRKFCTIGFFSFSKFLLYKDLKEESLLEIDISNSLVEKIIIGERGDSSKVFADDYEIDKEESKGNEVPDLVTDADSSQVSAIMDVLSGKNLVIEGPPGTGKSQTITNIIAACLHSGKKVLFVAEKNAALTVVKSRLDKLGLGHFCIELHSNKTQKNVVYKSIQDSLKFRNSSKDRNFYSSKKDEIEAVKAELKNYVKLLSGQNKVFETSYYELLWNSISLEKEIGIEVAKKIQRLEYPIEKETYKSELKFLEKIQDKFPNYLINELQENVWSFLCQKKVTLINFEDVLEDTIDISDEVERFYTSFGESLLQKLSLNELTTVTDLLRDPKFFDVNERMLKRVVSNRLDTELARQFVEARNDLNNLNQKISFLYDKNTININPDPTLKNFAKVESIYKEERVANLRSIIEELEKTREGLKRHLEIVNVLVNDNCSKCDQVKFLTRYVEKIIQIKKDSFPIKRRYISQDGVREVVKLRDSILEVSRFEFELKKIFSPDIVKVEEGVAFRWKSGVVNSGFFSFFNKEYRQVKREINSYLRIPYSKDTVVKSLHLLQDYISQNNELVRYEAYSWLKEDRQAINLEKLEMLIPTYELCLLIYNETKSFFGDNHDFLFDHDVKIAENLLSSLYFIEGILDRFSVNDVQEAHELISLILNELELLDKNISSDFEKIDNLKVYQVFNLYSLISQRNSVINSIETFYNICPELKDSTDDKVFNSFELGAMMLVSNLQVSAFEYTFNLISKTRDDFNSLAEVVKRLSFKLNAYEVQWAQSNITKKHLPIEEVKFKFTSLTNSKDLLRDFITYQTLLSEVSSFDFSRLINAFSVLSLKCGKLGKVYKYLVCNQECRKLFKRNSFLTLNLGDDLSKLREKFSRLDEDLKMNYQGRLVKDLTRAEVTRGVFTGRVSDKTELGFIEHQFTLKMRHAPIRTLIDRSSQALLDIMPCFMMSPLTVSQYLPLGKIKFDVLIMDEASQLRPEDSIGALFRANQVVIVGDQKQLPPTSFFDTSGSTAFVEEDEDENSISASDTDHESILAMANKSFKPARRLRWHYRSKHHDLISYSNKKFYDDELVVFPSPSGKSEVFGVDYQLVQDAVYENRRNLKEAEALLNWLQDFIIKYPDKSVGIVTMNQPQQELISDLIEKRLKDDPILEAYIKNFGEQDDDKNSRFEPLIVKNLENIQGDERDIILISTVYGRERNEPHVKQRFGPINTKMGHRRLNVLITRARYKNVIFTSLEPEDIKPSSGANLGVIVFKEYLKFAKTKQFSSVDVDDESEPDSDFERFVIGELRNNGFTVKCQVGVSGYRIDIGVVDPSNSDQFLCGIECDGATYHSAKSVRDRDKIRQEILESLGWKIYRIWSTDWFRNKEREIERLLEYLKNIRNA